MRYRIYKCCEFHASHLLPWHKGKCKYLHGHSYKVEFEVEADELDANGMLIDFTDLSALCKRYDHTHLNDLEPYAAGVSTTAENIARVLCEEVLRIAPPSVVRIVVRVWETGSSYAEACYEKAGGF